MTKFIDTNILLSRLDTIKDEDFFFFFSVTLLELEEIKSNKNKTEDIRYAARNAVRFLNDFPDKYKIIVYSPSVSYAVKCSLEDSPDIRIIQCAVYAKTVSGYDDLLFISNDILARMIAKEYFQLDVAGLEANEEEVYAGYIIKELPDDKLEYFYKHINENIFGLLNNQYIILQKDGIPFDIYRWAGSEMKKVCNRTIKSVMFGDKIQPKDAFQTCAIDSIISNTLTALSGKAGTGKSLISIITIMHLIETGKYDRVIIMFNPIKARGAADMGFYSGDSIEKAMQNSIGSILTTKFGDRFAVDMLIQQDKLRLVSMADIRGMEVRDSEILYIPEAENTSVDLIKLCLSRASSGCKIIIEGDYQSQVDSILFSGKENGMRRVIEAFKGRPEFGHVFLPNVWRSKIAELCELL